MGVFFSGLIPLLVIGGVVFAIVTGLRSTTADASEPLEPAEVAKSFALHVGLYVALIICAVGTIDVLQSLVEESDRLAGTNSDLARGLSFLIVGVPSGWLLLRTVARRVRGRIEGGVPTSRGWSIYLVAALTTTLIASLVSIGQIADDVTTSTSPAETTEVVQLAVWFGLWLAHWFVLRPRLGVRGDAHLAIGSIVGLGWLLSGIGAVTYRILDAGYDSAFDTSLASTRNLSFWAIIAVTGGVVWAWHWLGALNTPDQAPRLVADVEGPRRDSPLWSFTVVVAGILPGVVASLVTGAAMVSGLAIWFFGTTSDAAVDFFSPAPGLVAASLTGLLTWAYHQYELHLSQIRTNNERNESIRFGEYAVTAAGLVAVVGSVAAAVSLFVETVVADTPFAGSSRSDNAMILIVTVLLLGGMVWWQRWSHIEAERSAAPAEECDSLWRKLYLVLGFGVGGLVLGISLIWLLFAALQDLLDRTITTSTVEDLAGPLGWAIAVAGGVWYHLDVWNSDRSVLAARMPPPPTAPSPPSERPLMERRATGADTGELYTLLLADRGRRAGTAEADTTPLETIEAITARLATCDTTVTMDGTRIIGFVASPRDPESRAPVQAVIAPDRLRVPDPSSG